MKLLTVFLVCCVYFVFIRKWRKNTQKFYPTNRLFIFGHRGAPLQITENTVLSFKKALDQGVDGLEFDVRCTKDKKVIIFHDSDLNRLAGLNKKIKNLTYKELQEINLKRGEKIPLLDDFEELLDKKVVINIEIKSDSFLSGYGAINPVVLFIEKHSLQERCIVSCFNPLVLIRLKAKRPQTIIGYLYNARVPLHSWYNVIWMRSVRPDALHVHYDFLDTGAARWAKKQGLKVSCYTVNDRKTYEKIKKLNVDGVFTDNIEQLK